MITWIKKILATRLKRDQLIIAHHETLEAFGMWRKSMDDMMVVTMDRQEALYVDLASIGRIVADLIPNKADQRELLDKVAKLETASEAIELHLANFKKAINKLN